MYDTKTKEQNTTTETLKFKQRRCANGFSNWPGVCSEVFVGLTQWETFGKITSDNQKSDPQFLVYEILSCHTFALFFFGMGDKTRSFAYPCEFRKNCRKKLWQKQKTLFKKDSYRCHGPQKKSWLRCLFSGWDFWRLDGLEELWIFRTPKLTSSWLGFFL